VRHTRVIVTHYGGPEALRVVEEECPEPKASEVRVRVLAAGVALPDLMMREGVHPETPRLPFAPGWDLVGLVDRLGAGISGLAPGQIVAALRGGRLASGRSGHRHRFRGLAIFGWYIADGWLLPGRKRLVPYSIQWLKRLRSA
jgi:NADPH:quinone reductase-like Zn-dependent oxidoreductase